MMGINDFIDQLSSGNKQDSQSSIPGFLQQLFQQGSQQQGEGAGGFQSMMGNEQDTASPSTGHHSLGSNQGLLTQAQGGIVNHFLNKALNSASQDVNTTGGGMQGGMQSASDNMVPEGSGGSYGFSGLDSGGSSSGAGAGSGASSGGGKGSGGGAAAAEDA